MAIAVEPRLLADSLERALARSDIDVVICLDDAEDPSGGFDLAVVTGSVPDGLRADVVVRLPPTGSEPGSITTARGTEPALLGNLAGLLQTLDRFLRP